MMRNIIKKILKESDFDWISSHIDHLEWIKIFLEEELNGYDIDIELIDDTTSEYDSDLWDFEDVSGRGLVVGLPNRHEPHNHDVISYLIQINPNNSIVVSEGSVYYTDENDRSMHYQVMGEYTLKDGKDFESSIEGIARNISKMYIKPHIKSLNNITESDDLDWIRDIDVDLIPGEKYFITTGNGYYWESVEFSGINEDGYYLFGDGNHRMSREYVKEKLSNGKIREYDPNWSILNEIEFSDSIDDINGRNFVIYFEGGVKLDDTKPIQDLLFKKGFKWYGKNVGEYITNKYSDKDIIFFESYNWDTSNPRYEKMSSTQRTDKLLLLVPYSRDFSDPFLEEQRKFGIVVDHDAIVINGDKYIK